MTQPYKRFEEQYVENVANIIKNGVLIPNDRTGVGTRMLTGLVWRANLQQEFPLLTTKHMGIFDVYAELRVFNSGSTNNNDFHAEKCTIWDEWAGEIGMLGPIYSAMWRRRPAAVVLYEQRKERNFRWHQDYDFFDHRDNPTAKTQLKSGNPFDQKIWDIHCMVLDMVHDDVLRIYKPWLEFDNFRKDFFKIPGCEQIIALPGYVPSIHGQLTDAVGPETLMFIRKEYEEMYPVRVEGKKKFAPIFFIDQIAEVMKDLRAGSTSRRMVVDCWDPSVLPAPGVAPNKQPELGRQVLACCHDHFQFHYLPPAKEGQKPRVSITMTQRSADSCLGIPYNMASYSLLLMMVAKIFDYEPWEVTITTGDTHVYLNHIDTARKQIRRKIHQAPKVWFEGEQNSLDDFKKEHLKITRFNKAIKTHYDVAV